MFAQMSWQPSSPNLRPLFQSTPHTKPHLLDPGEIAGIGIYLKGKMPANTIVLGASHSQLRNEPPNRFYANETQVVPDACTASASACSLSSRVTAA
jgi:hypothetical protein